MTKRIGIAIGLGAAGVTAALTIGFFGILVDSERPRLKSASTSAPITVSACRPVLNRDAKLRLRGRAFDFEATANAHTLGATLVFVPALIALPDSQRLKSETEQAHRTRPPPVFFPVV